MVVADAETTDERESIEWVTTGGDFAPLPNSPGNPMGNACNGTFQINGKTALCAANSSTSKTGTPMLVTAALGAQPWSVTQKLTGDGLQGVAFGLMFAKASAEVVLDGRIDSDQFTVSMEAEQIGSLIQATTSGTGVVGGTASTGEHELLVPFGSEATIAMGISGTADGWEDDYVQSWSCTRSGELLYEGPSATQVALGVGQHVHCTVTLVPPRLTLQKVVENNFGGTADATEWELTAAGVMQVSGTAGTAETTSVPVRTGDYDLTESTTGPAGYGAEGWVCNDVSVGEGAQGVVSINKGTDTTCVVTNKDLPGSLAWSKVDADDVELMLPGSKWTLQGPGDDGDLIEITDCVEDAADACASHDKDPTLGNFRLGNLHWGAYTLTEIEAPNGYLLVDGPISVTIEGEDTEIALSPIENERILGSVEWSKVDAATDELLAGSQWTLLGPGDDGELIEITDCVGDNTAACAETHDQDPGAGQFRIEGLAWGDYELVETEAPTGYTLIEGPIQFTVDSENADVGIALGAVPNERTLGTVSWSKTDPDGTRLAGSQWALTGPLVDGDPIVIDVDDCVADSGQDCAGSDQDPRAGEFLSEGLEWGEYTLVETYAPAGYVLDTTEYTFTISAESLSHAFEVAFVNEPREMPPLPHTGGLGRDLFSILGFSVFTLGLGAVAAVQIRRRREGVA